MANHFNPSNLSLTPLFIGRIMSEMLRSRGPALFVFFFCLVSFANGTVEERLNLHLLAQKSDLIAIGRVVKLETVVESGEPWTLATVSLEKQMKGAHESVVQIRLPGGLQKIGNRILVTQVEGVPLPNVNERAVVFLSGKDKTQLALTGLGQGYWKIDIDQEGKEVARKSEGQDGSRIHLDSLVLEVQRVVRDLKQ